jgi:hypothetical protein
VIVDQVQRLDGIRAHKTNSIVICIPRSEESEVLFDGILESLHKHPGSDEVLLEMAVEGVQVRIRANPALRVQHGPALVSDLKQLGCSVDSGAKVARASRP